MADTTPNSNSHNRVPWWIIGILTSIILTGSGSYLVFGGSVDDDDLSDLKEELTAYVRREILLTVPTDTVSQVQFASLERQISDLRDDIREVRQILMRTSVEEGG